MFAIEINGETLDKILQIENLPEERKLDVRVISQNTNSWCLVRGYHNVHGKFFDWTILPMYIIVENFEHDPIKIKTEFDQIVRK